MNTRETQAQYTDNPTSAEHERAVYIRRQKQKRIKRIIITLLLLSSFFLLTTLYSQYQVFILKDLEDSKTVPRTNDEIIKAISHHILLPEGGRPQIATIQNVEKIKRTQDFFKNAVNGDIVLISGNLILIYRPSKDVLVSVGDISGATLPSQ
jgi:hypothetical protein